MPLFCHSKNLGFGGILDFLDQEYLLVHQTYKLLNMFYKAECGSVKV